MLGLRAIARTAISKLLQRGNGVEIFLPAITIGVADIPPAVRSGGSVRVPLSTMVVADEAPRVAISATVTVPSDNTSVVEDYAPIVRSGGSVRVPVSVAVTTSLSPSIRSGARVDVPLSAVIASDPVLEINARRRRVKTQVIQS